VKRLSDPILLVLLLLPSVLVTGCSKEERASAELNAIEEAYAETELGRDERLAEFTLRYEALAEKYAGTGAALEAESWLLRGTSLDEEDDATAELAAIEEAYAESDLERSEKEAEFMPQYEALAEEYWGTNAALEAKLWVMSRTTRGLDDEEEASMVGEYTDAIFERYARSPHAEQLGQLASSFTEEQRDQYFGELRETSPHASVRAAVIYGQAWYKKAFMRYGQVEDTPETREEIEADLELLVEEYADVPRGTSTYGVMADALLNAYTDEELGIGQPAPEIVGVTADGEEIRLSDFLGKVTVIDFWGDW
jgi:hypothetical protein